MNKDFDDVSGKGLTVEDIIQAAKDYHGRKGRYPGVYSDEDLETLKKANAEFCVTLKDGGWDGVSNPWAYIDEAFRNAPLTSAGSLAQLLHQHGLVNEKPSKDLEGPQEP